MIITKSPIDLERRLQKVMDEAIELADLGGRRTPTQQIAERIYDSEPDLMEEVRRSWMIERLGWMLARRRRERWDQSGHGLQMVLPDPVFQGLPRMIYLPNGRRSPLETATVRDITDHMRMLRRRGRERDGSKLKQMEAVLEVMRRYSPVKRGITWAEVKQLEASRLPEAEKD